MSGHQPKELTELAFASFTAYMKDKALQLLNWIEVSPTSTDKATKTCRELKDFFHDTRLPTVLANEITKRLLTKLGMFSVIYGTTRMDYFQQTLLTLVEVFMHPDVTSIELGPSYLYDIDDYSNFILKLILMKVGHLPNLKTLSVGLGINNDLKHVKLVLPTQLKELTLCGTLFMDCDNMKRIVECCRELKSLKIVRCRYANISVPDILKLNRLETLHLLGENICGLDAACMAVINGISTNVSSDVLSASTLKSFGTELRDENTLRLIVDKLPHLTEIVLQLPYELDLSCLTQLKTLRSLTLNAGERASDDYKKILPVLGKSLVSLDLRCYDYLDLEFIGETCSNLRCLHVNTSACFPLARPKPSFKTFPNFKTIECLKVNMVWYADWVEFVIVQCVNIKLLSVVFGSWPSIITNVLKRTCSLTSLEEIHWYPEVSLENTCLEELCLKCPNLRLVHGLGSDSFTSGRVVFNLYGCPNSFCEIYCYSLNMAGHQPKELTELAFASFTAYMKDQALQFLKWMEDSLSCAEIETKASGTCRELKDFFHGMRLPPVLANEISIRLLTMLDTFSVIYESTGKDYVRQILLPLVEVFLHPNVTSIELGSSYLYNCDHDYYNFILSVILMKVICLRNLKTLSVGLGLYTDLKGVKLVLPAQLKELTLCGTLFLDNDNLKSIVECCRELKSFKIMRLNFADISVPHLLKLNRLETLHLLAEVGEEGYGSDPICVALINGISTNETSDVLSASTLKSFGTELRDENTLHLIVDKLPHLTEIVLELPCEFDLSCLTRLKNLRSLTLDADGRSTDNYKKILPVLGKSLVSLDLQRYNYLDLEFIGETCSNLRCLHVNTTASLPAVHPSPPLKTFPNFRTVECLKIRMWLEYEWAEFVIVQCVNIKLLSIVSYSQPTIINNVVYRTSFTNLEEIHMYPALRTANCILEELCLKCPNLRLVHGLGSDSFISGRVVFNFRGCRKSLCEIYCHPVNESDTED